jgi:hypothetical protein
MTFHGFDQETDIQTYDMVTIGGEVDLMSQRGFDKESLFNQGVAGHTIGTWGTGN